MTAPRNADRLRPRYVGVVNLPLPEPARAEITDRFLDELADQEQWDYEAHGNTETYLLLPAGLLPLSALVARNPGARSRVPPAAPRNAVLGTGGARLRLFVRRFPVRRRLLCRHRGEPVTDPPGATQLNPKGRRGTPGKPGGVMRRGGPKPARHHWTRRLDA